MKKILLLIIFISFLFLTGCGKNSESDVLKQLQKNIEKTDSYYLEGQMEIMNNEDIYLYDVKVSYKKNDYYKVDLTNTSNNHQQVILRNDDGVYVVTPSLNKSFKFQSDWPYNNSQVYLLGSILDDLKNDKDKTFKANKTEFVFTSNVNYPNNKKLVKQKIIVDDDYKITEVQVLDKDNNIQIKMIFSKIDMKAKFNKDYFELNDLVKLNEEEPKETNEKKEKVPEEPNNETEEQNTNTEEQEPSPETENTATIDDIVYPMYLPGNTYLSNQETVDTDTGQRLILTFDGDSPFMLIEETVSYSEEHMIIPTYGDLELLVDTVGIVNDNSVNWVSNNVEYYVISDVMSTMELLEVARSISILPVSK